MIRRIKLTYNSWISQNLLQSITFYIKGTLAYNQALPTSLQTAALQAQLRYGDDHMSESGSAFRWRCQEKRSPSGLCCMSRVSRRLGSTLLLISRMGLTSGGIAG